MNAQQEFYIRNLHKKAQDIFRKFIALAQERTGYTVYVIRGYATIKEQAKIRKKYEQEQRDLKAGRIKPSEVTIKAAARPGSSLHNFGFTLDINLFKEDEKITLRSTREQWLNTGVPQIAKELGLKWGDVYNNDFVHFEIPMDAKQLFALAQKQFGTNPENIRGNEVLLA